MPKKGAKKAKRPTAFTEKGAASYASSGNPGVDFFFKAVRGLADNETYLTQMLEACWEQSPIDTVKLIFQTRDCRGGKGEKAIFHESLRWLALNHPETLQKNIEHIPFFGSWKDVLALMGGKFEDDALDMYAKQLRLDHAIVEAAASGKAEDKKKSISLAVKWAPTENHKEDKKTKAASKLATRLSEGVKPVAMKQYRKKYIAPLRAYLKVTETFMCANEWEKIPYQGVASRCMNLSREAFRKHDSTRFEAFLEDVKSGKATIKGKQMFPHELAASYMKGGKYDEVIEQQWKVIADQVRKMGALTDSIVLSDVSGSMSGTPMEVAIGLGLLISEVTAQPFTNFVITFHENPTFFKVPNGSLKDRVTALQAAPWGGTTNFQAVFTMILDKAKENKLPASAMPKRLFVISDMQFDAADGSKRYTTNHMEIQNKYKAAGYTMPQMVYWNVRSGTSDYPTPADEKGVALVSGFSPSIMKSLIEAGDFADPATIVKEVLANERYSILKV